MERPRLRAARLWSNLLSVTPGSAAFRAGTSPARSRGERELRVPKYAQVTGGTASSCPAHPRRGSRASCRPGTRGQLGRCMSPVMRCPFHRERSDPAVAEAARSTYVTDGTVATPRASAQPASPSRSSAKRMDPHPARPASSSNLARRRTIHTSPLAIAVSIGWECSSASSVDCSPRESSDAVGFTVSSAFSPEVTE
jgi:hypothetical protein